VSIDTKRRFLFLSYLEITTDGYRMLCFNADLEFNFFTDYYFTRSSSFVNNGFKRPIFLLDQSFITPLQYFTSTTPLFNVPICVSTSHSIQKYVVNQRNGLTYFLNTIGHVYSILAHLVKAFIRYFIVSYFPLQIR
jgi:hypothetical protein